MIQLRFANQTRVREFFRYAPVLASIVLCHTVAAAQTDPEVPQSEEQLRLDVQDVVYVRPLGDPGAWTHIASELASDPSSDHPALVMNTAPGVNIQMNSGQEHLVSIRSPVLTGGAGQGSFLVLIDGVPTRAPAFGNVNALFEIPYETAAGIEIVRGPGSARYGSNAVHGVINVIERSPADTESFAQASINTEDRLRFDGVSTRKIGDHDWMLAGSVLSDPGWREASGVEQQKLTAKLDGNMGPWNWLLTVDGTNLNQETAGYIQGEDAYKDRDLARSNPNPEAFRDAWSARTNLRLQRELGHGELTLIPFALTQRMIFKQHFLPYKGLEKNGHDSVGLLSRYALNAGNVDWTIGADAQWANGYLTETQDTPFGFFPGDSRFPVGVHYDYTVETISLAGFAEARVRLAENWRLLAGLRAEHHDYDYGTDIPAGVFGRFKVAADRSDRFTLITPKLGVTWSAPAGVDIYANYSRGERAPQSSDLYRLQSLQEIADVDVETNDSIEIGMRGQLSSGVDYNLAIYAMEKSNFFFRDADDRLSLWIEISFDEMPVRFFCLQS